MLLKAKKKDKKIKAVKNWLKSKSDHLKISLIGLSKNLLISKNLAKNNKIGNISIKIVDLSKFYFNISAR